MTEKSQIAIRDLASSDRDDWTRLWTDYLTYYETKLPADIYETTWQRLFDPNIYEPKGKLALVAGKPVGLVHFIQHRSCWSKANSLYLQDLYADPDVRGTGIGRALIEAVYAHADGLGIRNVYWMTKEDNATGRRLYDRVARRTGFIEYDRG